jgi:glutamate/tyrosine decarboxylase-like PLP-dependent enzyme
MADFLAAGMNPNCWGGDHAAIHVEERVMRWLAQILGFPASAEGILVSGGSMANFTALAAARRAMTPGNVREEGLAGEGRPRLTVYASDQVHSASTRPWTCSASAGGSCGRSRPTSDSACGWTCWSGRSPPTAAPG